MIPRWSIGIAMQGCSPSPLFWKNVTFLGVPGPSRRAPPDLVPDRIRPTAEQTEASVGQPSHGKLPTRSEIK